MELQERLAKEAFWSPAKTGSKKNSDRAVTPATEVVCGSEHLAPPESLQAKQLHHHHGQLSLGKSCHRQKKKKKEKKQSCLWTQGRFGPDPLFAIP